jgi:preprotein translocase subunit SecY
MIKIFKHPELRRKILLTLLLIVASRLVAHIPVPGVDIAAIRSYLSGNALFGFFDLFSGGGFQNFSIVTLGLAPYINASIVMQLLTVMVPSLEELAKEGEIGREKINMYTKFMTVPMTLIQAYGIYFLLSKQGVIGSLAVFDLITLVLTMSAGSMLLVWLGDLITEYGIGNGVSLLIFVSIIGRLPMALYGFLATVTADNFMNVIIFTALAVAVVTSVVLVNEGTRNITIEYGRTGVKSQKVTNFLPIKINQAGVIPIIFAVSVVMMPSLLGGPLKASTNAFLHNLGSFFTQNFHSNSPGYNILYFILVVGFTYFYTSVQFNPEKIADDVKKRGGFVPGVRPGSATTLYLKKIVNRITLAGALFLGAIAILPYLVQSLVNVSSLTIGGTGLLIVVSVVLETIRQVESLTVSQSYERFLQ